jgi:hypothetical protein
MYTHVAVLLVWSLLVTVCAVDAIAVAIVAVTVAVAVAVVGCCG